MQVAEHSDDKSQKQVRIDAHHCKCFFLVSKEEEIKLFKGLKSIGAYDQQLQEPHGQKWGLTYRLDDYWQLHIKMMPGRRIESEIEARIIYAEHQTIKSKPAHYEMQQLLEKLRINYAFITPIPEPCRNRVLNTPGNPTDIAQLGMVFAIGLMAVVIAAIAVYVMRKMETEG